MYVLALWTSIERAMRTIFPADRWSSDDLQLLFLGAIACLLMIALLIMGRKLYMLIRPERPPSKLNHKQKVYVEHVIDGDTFWARLGRRRQHRIKIRVLGIDAPESSRNAKVVEDAKRKGSSVTAQIRVGNSAKKRVKQLVESHHVILEAPDKGTIKKDVYGRYLAYVRLKNKRDLGLILIEEGLAEDFGWKYPHPRKTAYQNAQRKAPDLFKRKSWWRRLLRR